MLSSSFFLRRATACTFQPSHSKAVQTVSFRTIRQLHTALRTLFCGADTFSIYSLNALHKLHTEKPQTIASIDVVCRPDKRVGRGLKQIQQVPIKKVAEDLGLPLHQIDTFTGWTPPAPCDLVIAVSFGLLVPGRILRAATYGGLNVHPSMLPDLRGAAPIQHTLLQARSHTGVTLQTMHPTHFDHGTIVDQTSHPGIPVPENSIPEDLVHVLGSAGAEMLCRGIEDHLFVSPKPFLTSDRCDLIHHAPKITPADRRIDWAHWTADQIRRRDRVLGRLWDTTTYQACHAKDPKRVTFGGPWRVVPREDLHELDQGYVEGAPTLSHVDGPRQPRLAFHTADGKIISPESVTIEGEPKGKGMFGLLQAIKNSHKVVDGKDGHAVNGNQRIWY